MRDCIDWGDKEIYATSLLRLAMKERYYKDQGFYIMKRFLAVLAVEINSGKDHSKNDNLICELG